MTDKNFTILLIPGDGVGAEVIPAAAEALDALALNLNFIEAEAGFACFTRHGDALPAETLALARQADAVLFGATASPSRRVEGYRSPILTLRRELGLFANLRPVVSMPIPASRPDVDLLIVRENSEGLYSGRERMETPDIAIAERVITRSASLRIARLACELALRRAVERQHAPRLTVIHKANVLKLSDGLFRECALQAASEHPEIEVNEMLIDAAAMHILRSPQQFDVLLAPNLYGDILSDEASALVGGVGVAPSANLGESTPVFEPVHGSAPDIAGKGIANPVGAMLSAALMLDVLSLSSPAQRLREAVQRTLTAGICTPDVGGTATTRSFTQAVCRALRD